MLMQALVSVNLNCCHKSEKQKISAKVATLNSNSADKTFNVNVTV